MGTATLYVSFTELQGTRCLLLLKLYETYRKGNKLEISLFSSLESDAMLITPTVYLLNCVKIN